jgi:hypothetical protein
MAEFDAIEYCFLPVGDGGESYQWVAIFFKSCASLSFAFIPLLTRYAIIMPLIPKGRISYTHLAFYISTFVIATQLWSIWRQSASSYNIYPGAPGKWEFDADLHANVHTLDNEQCDSAFPKLYHSLDQSVSQRRGRKVHINDIAIVEGRCMMRVMVYDGEVCVIWGDMSRSRRRGVDIARAISRLCFYTYSLSYGYRATTVFTSFMRIDAIATFLHFQVR